MMDFARSHLSRLARPIGWGGAIALILLIVAILFALNPFSSPQPGRNLFGSKAQFRAWVLKLELEVVPTVHAVERLAAHGFSCETFKDGNVACFREARGTTCGERQFVDLLVPGKKGAAHEVSTRFGTVCL